MTMLCDLSHTILCLGYFAIGIVEESFKKQNNLKNINVLSSYTHTNSLGENLFYLKVVLKGPFFL